MRGWKEIVPMFFVHPVGIGPQLLAVPADILEHFDKPGVRQRVYEAVRAMVRKSPVEIEYVSYVADAWVCELNEEGRKHQKEVDQHGTQWVVEQGYGERWEALQIRVECRVGGYMMMQKYKRKTGRLYCEGEPEGREFLLGEDLGPASSFFGVPREIGETAMAERKPS
jgi:hypothetical protein